jgi:hypothetical protein
MEHHRPQLQPPPPELRGSAAGLGEGGGCAAALAYPQSLPRKPYSEVEQSTNTHT